MGFRVLVDRERRRAACWCTYHRCAFGPIFELDDRLPGVPADLIARRFLEWLDATGHLKAGDCTHQHGDLEDLLIVWSVRFYDDQIRYRSALD